MKQLLPLLAYGLLVPSAALARVNPNVAAQCQDARDFYGCVRAFTTPVRRSDDTAAFDGVMEQVAAGLISGSKRLMAAKLQWLKWAFSHLESLILHQPLVIQPM